MTSGIYGIVNQFQEDLILKSGSRTTTYYSFETVSKIVASVLEQKKTSSANEIR